MQISLPIEIEKTSTNVIDTTEVFKVVEHRNFAPDLEMQFGGKIYQNVSGLIEIPTYAPETTYALGDLVFKSYTVPASGSGIHKVTGVGDTGRVPKQPAEYANVDLGTTPSAWQYRYVKLFNDYTDGNTYTVGNVKHTFEDGRFDSGVIRHIREFVGGPRLGEVWIQDVPCSLEVSNYDAEAPCYVPDNEFYAFQSFVSIDDSVNDVLYARTHIEADIDYNDTPPEMTFTAISHINEISGFVPVRPTLDNAPFDPKHYSTATKTGYIDYTIRCDEDFDTLALGNVIGTTMNVYFKNSIGTTITSEVGYVIDNSRDSNDVLPGVGTTVILYAASVIGKGGSIVLRVYGNDVSIGTIMGGINVNAGFTDLTFSNKFNDYSPYEKDNWGNIAYIDGVRVQVHSGSVQIYIADYDMINRLITSIGGNTIILNGSDTLDNSEPDNATTFSSTMIIGRWKVSELKTRLKDREMDQYASYGFTIEEQV